MVEQVPSSVFDERNATGVPPVNAIVQTEQNAQAGLREDYVCGLEGDVIEGDIPTRTGQPVRGEEFLDGKMRKVNHLGIPILDNCNQAGTRRQYCLVVVCPSPIGLQLRNSSVCRRIKINREDLCQFFNTQGPKRDGETLQET